MHAANPVECMKLTFHQAVAQTEAAEPAFVVSLYKKFAKIFEVLATNTWYNELNIKYKHCYIDRQEKNQINCLVHCIEISLTLIVVFPRKI